MHAGTYNALILKPDGTLWGSGIGNRLGLGYPEGGDLNLQTWIQIMSGVQSYSIGPYNTFLIKTDGTLWVTGYNNHGQLGLGDFTFRSTFVQVGTDTNWTNVSVHVAHAMAIKGGVLYSTGWNEYGQLGQSDIVERNSFTQVGSDTNWLKVEVGASHSVALKTTGTIWSCGRNLYGELGLGDFGQRFTFSQIGVDTNWALIDVGAYTTFCIKTTGTLWACGRGENGETGLGVYGNNSSLTQVGTDSNWESVDGATYHTVARKTDGSTWSTGSNGWAQLATGDFTTRNTFEEMDEVSGNWSAVSADGYSSFTMDSSGNVYGVGDNSYQALGVESEDNKWLCYFTQIGYDRDWTVVSCGYSHSVALKEDGTLWTTGNGGWGQLGNGSLLQHETFTKIGTATDWVKIQAGLAHTMALKSNGTLWVTGNNQYGQLGLGDKTNRLSFTQVGSATDWVDIFASDYGLQSFALKGDASLWATGANSDGRLGVGDWDERIVFTQVPGEWLTVASGEIHTLGIDIYGNLWAWGNNGKGELGIGNYDYKNIPTQVDSELEWIEVKAGWGWGYAKASNRSIWSCGANGLGQLGQGNFDNSQWFTQVGTDTDWEKYDCGCCGSFGFFIKENNSIWGVGDNSSCQLGLGPLTGSVGYYYNLHQRVVQMAGGHSASNAKFHDVSCSLTSALALGWYTPQDIPIVMYKFRPIMLK